MSGTRKKDISERSLAFEFRRGSLNLCITFYSFFPRQKLEETREVQNLRKRPNGVSAAALLVGEKVQEETTLVVSVGSSLWLLFLR